ncbi:DUF3397 domain-containing protein [Bacillus massilinigeriensis]|uniref:DUF3397 domain-containing protein n=1 Tax=Bacillus mediterraneensis TaxID=1805474 RepID=UPI0008F7F3FE|nr:DUF3397 domain-containing protein [Bacillus mediterraneensis]
MSSLFAGAAALLVTVPPAAYLLAFIASKQITGNHKKSVKLAVDVTTLFFLLAVHYLILTIWGKSFFWLLLLLLLVIGAAIAFSSWKHRQEIDYIRVFKGVWRSSFLFFALLYLILVAIGLLNRLLILDT